MYNISMKFLSMNNIAIGIIPETNVVKCTTYTQNFMKTMVATISHMQSKNDYNNTK